MRYALISTWRQSEDREPEVRAIARYLPHAYSVLAHWNQGANAIVLVGGEDVAGWTLDGYVLPRLGSGNYGGHEIPANEARALLQAGEQ